MKALIAALPGDGIGPEVTAQAVKVLRAVGDRFGHTFVFSEAAIGGASIRIHGVPLANETLDMCKASDAVLLGAVGGPQWDVPGAKTRPEQGLLSLRQGLNVFANLRPVTIHPALYGASPLKPELLKGVDLLFVRELTGGLYFGKPKGRTRNNGHVTAVDTMEYQDFEIERILRTAFQLSLARRRKVTSVDKANVLETSKLWRETADSLRPEFPSVTLDHMLVDTASMRLMTTPSDFDVIVTENMFGDILTDEASVLGGSLGMLPSASLGTGKPGLYEPIHGSAPDLAGQGIANPIGAIRSAAMLLRHSLGLEIEAETVEQAVFQALVEGFRTPDLGGSDSTEAMTEAVLEGITTPMRQHS